jgi:hypothetical protein
MSGESDIVWLNITWSIRKGIENPMSKGEEYKSAPGRMKSEK